MADTEGPDRRAFRIGIDVGGTFTKAVLIDNRDRSVVGRYSVLTTHDDPRGVARGVVEVFRNVLEGSAVDPIDVVFLAHSTTQATNALLEGDVAAVGIIGMSSRLESLLARGQTAIGPIELAPGRFLTPQHRFIYIDAISEETVSAAISALAASGAKVIVASNAFGVDDNTHEMLVMKGAHDAGLCSTGGHEITKLYGLTTRTRTAVINASILPRMIATANMTEASVREAGIQAPMMIMRGDGGVMGIQEMRRRPAVTMLSGPAASVAGALMHLKVSDGIYFEVGGTSTNIGVIRNGRPTIRYARVGGHETYVNSLDVRVIGIAGGSMVRVSGNAIHDVGPRSAHIAGLGYACFTDPAAIVDPEFELFRPKPDDPADYVAIRCANGIRVAITNSCAANLLGYATPGMHSYGNPEAVRRAIAPLARHLHCSAEEVARQILERASRKLIPVVESLIAEYRLDSDQAELIGEGGGAGALIPFVSEKTGLRFRISQDAEVISSIGVALALVRETIERTIPNARPEDIAMIKHEAFDAVVRLGAAPDNVEVTIEVDPQTQRVRATAMGSSEMRAQDFAKEIDEAEGRSIAAASMSLPEEAVTLAANTGPMRVFQGIVTERKWRFFTKTRRPVRAIDHEGVIRVQRSNATVTMAPAGEGLRAIRTLWESLTSYTGVGNITPDLFVLVGAHVIDLSGVLAVEQALAVAKGEFEGLPPDAPIALIAVAGARGMS